jgi:hypothetical protein
MLWKKSIKICRFFCYTHSSDHLGKRQKEYLQSELKKGLSFEQTSEKIPLKLLTIKRRDNLSR